MLISGAPTLSECYRDTIQELNQLAITRALVKWNGMVTRLDRISEMVDHAFRTATIGRKGPVHLDVPRDLLLETGDVEMAPRQPSPRFPAVLPSSEAIKRAGQLLVGTQRPLIIAGGGSKWADATDEIVKLAEILSIPMATSYAHRRCSRRPSAYDWSAWKRWVETCQETSYRGRHYTCHRNTA